MAWTTVKQGQWRNLPKDFPSWKIVYYYFTVWRAKKAEQPSILEVVLKKNNLKISKKFWKEKYDGGKKISGIKRHIAVDVLGLPHSIHVTTVEVTDRNGAILMFKNHKERLPLVKNVMADGGENFANAIKEILGCGVEIAKRNELHNFKVMPKRWIVERTFGWLEKCRRLWKNCERELNTSFNFVITALISIVLKRF